MIALGDLPTKNSNAGKSPEFYKSDRPAAGISPHFLRSFLAVVCADSGRSGREALQELDRRLCSATISSPGIDMCLSVRAYCNETICHEGPAFSPSRTVLHSNFVASDKTVSVIRIPRFATSSDLALYYYWHASCSC